MGRFKDGLPLAAAVLLATGGIGYGLHEHFQAVELTSREQALTHTIGQLGQQVAELTDRFNHKEDTEDAGKETPAPVKAPPRRVRVPAVRVAPAPKRDDQELRRVERLYADEALKIASAEREVQDTRQELEGKLSSTKVQLSDSIAKTHEQLIELQKRGETDYTEFTLDKLKDFRQVGPVSVALTKADTKHQRYNMELMVEQVKLEKKNVSLLEPVYLKLSDWPQPVVLVVNQIAKNEVRGYMSLPKYKKSSLVRDASVRPEQADSPQ